MQTHKHKYKFIHRALKERPAKNRCRCSVDVVVCGRRLSGWPKKSLERLLTTFNFLIARFVIENIKQWKIINFLVGRNYYSWIGASIFHVHHHRTSICNTILHSYLRLSYNSVLLLSIHGHLFITKKRMKIYENEWPVKEKFNWANNHGF